MYQQRQTTSKANRYIHHGPRVGSVSKRLEPRRVVPTSDSTRAEKAQYPLHRAALRARGSTVGTMDPGTSSNPAVLAGNRGSPNVLVLIGDAHTPVPLESSRGLKTVHYIAVVIRRSDASWQTYYVYT